MRKINKIKLRSKKGIFDTITMVIILIVLVITLIVSVYVGLVIQDAISPKLEIEDNTSATAFNNGINTTIKFGDWIFLVVFIIFILGIILTSFMFYTHPIFSVLFIILSIGVVLLSIFVSNTYETMTNRPEFAETMTKFPMANWIMLHLPIIMTVVTLMGVVIIYAKGQSFGMQNAI